MRTLAATKRSWFFLLLWVCVIPINLSLYWTWYKNSTMVIASPCHGLQLGCSIVFRNLTFMTTKGKPQCWVLTSSVILSSSYPLSLQGDLVVEAVLVASGRSPVYMCLINKKNEVLFVQIHDKSRSLAADRTQSSLPSFTFLWVGFVWWQTLYVLCLNSPSSLSRNFLHSTIRSHAWVSFCLCEPPPKPTCVAEEVKCSLGQSRAMPLSHFWGRTSSCVPQEKMHLLIEDEMPVRAKQLISMTTEECLASDFTNVQLFLSSHSTHTG